LGQLFVEHGRPLVLKSDNGSAFLELSNGVLKTYTVSTPIHRGHPFRWTSEDLEHARGSAV
jgi:hypothetical protein